MSEPLIRVENLNIAIAGATIVSGLNLELFAGQCVALVGESGAGKSMTGRALLGLLPDACTSSATTLTLFGQEFYGPHGPVKDRVWRGVRGRHIGLVSQDALVSLDPLRKVGKEVSEPLELHFPRMGRTARQNRVVELMTSVAIPLAQRRARQYPHELSGGLRQRALIASGLAGDPKVLIADEPTTALDSTVAAQILTLLGEIKAAGTALVLISHDLHAVAQLADHILVLKDGQVVEEGPAAQVLESPSDPYTKDLLSAVPDGNSLVLDSGHVGTAQGAPAQGVPAQGVPVLQARGLRKEFRLPGGDPLIAVANADFDLMKGQTLGLVGESGSGKSTLARMLLAIEPPTVGTVDLHGEAWNGPGVAESHRRPRRWRVQFVPQDAYSAMNKSWTVEQIIGEFVSAKHRQQTPADRTVREDGKPRLDREARRDRIVELLSLVGLDSKYLGRKPGQLSGGQRQRVAIARALATNPEVLICDEPVSALDVTVQAQVVRLLVKLQRDLGVAILFISHDLAVVRQVAHQIMVLKDGVVVEQGPADRVYENPKHPYTRELLAARLGERL